jgi:hypothetical protein
MHLVSLKTWLSSGEESNKCSDANVCIPVSCKTIVEIAGTIFRACGSSPLLVLACMCWKHRSMASQVLRTLDEASTSRPLFFKLRRLLRRAAQGTLSVNASWHGWCIRCARCILGAWCIWGAWCISICTLRCQCTCYTWGPSCSLN